MKKKFNSFQDFKLYLGQIISLKTGYMDECDVDFLSNSLFNENELKFREKELLKYTTKVSYQISPYPYKFYYEKYYDEILDIRKIRQKKLNFLNK